MLFILYLILYEDTLYLEILILTKLFNFKIFNFIDYERYNCKENYYVIHNYSINYLIIIK